MTVNPTYLPPVKNKKRKPIIISLVVFLLLFGSLLVFYWKQQSQDNPLVSDLPTICEYSADETKNILNKIETTPEQMMSDYFYYGETLLLLENKYELGERDPFLGRQVHLENLCNEQVVSFLLTNHLDGNIPVEELEEGFYLASIELDLENHVLVSDEILDDTFYTMNRDGVQKRINIIADENYFVDNNLKEKIFNQHYVFIEVIEEKAPEIVYDIMIDPAHNDQDFGPLDQGLIEDDFVEADALYELAKKMKIEFESYGLKVGISREKQEILNTYGQPSRVYSAYETSAKIMIELDMIKSLDVVTVVGSSYGLLSLPEMVAQEIPDGVGTVDRRLGLLDYHNLIRETGGYALGATRYSEISERLNQFAKENRHGTQTISIQFPTMEKGEQLIESSVQGIINYINIQP